MAPMLASGRADGTGFGHEAMPRKAIDVAAKAKVEGHMPLGAILVGPDGQSRRVFGVIQPISVKR